MRDTFPRLRHLFTQNTEDDYLTINLTNKAGNSVAVDDLPQIVELHTSTYEIVLR